MIVRINREGEALYQLNPNLVLKVGYRVVQNTAGIFKEVRLTLSDGSHVDISRATFEGIRDQLPWFDKDAKMVDYVAAGVYSTAAENEYWLSQLPTSAEL